MGLGSEGSRPGVLAWGQKGGWVYSEIIGDIKRMFLSRIHD